MPIRFYLVPVDTLPRGATSTFRLPRHITVGGDPRGLQLVTAQFQCMNFGLEPVCLMAIDVTNGQHTTLAAQSDVVAIPLNLDNTLGANLGTVQSALEARGIPADALTSGMTYRHVLRGVIAIFAIAKRFHRDANRRLFPPGITFSTTLAELPTNVRTQLRATAESLAYNYDGLTGASTVRDMLKAMVTQRTPASMLGVSI